jgi:outer membrane receptor for ferrienterochelin and colicin
MRIPMLVLFLASLVAWGCASSGNATSRPMGSRNLITRGELEEMPALTAREAIERLHRDWLRGRTGTLRTATGRRYPEVFVDGRPFGSLDALSQFTTESIEEIRFISGPDATTRYGTGYPAGIIEIIIRRRSLPGN